MGKILLFNIRNQQDEYAKSICYINKLEMGLEITAPSTFAGYIECDFQKDTYEMACNIEINQNLNMDINFIREDITSKNVYFYFNITMEKEDDIVNLMYYYLIKQYFQRTIAVLSTPGLEYDMKIGAYLTFEMKKNKNTIFIKTAPAEIKKYGVVHRLPGSSNKIKKEWRLTKFLPLIEVKSETYAFLSSPVEVAKKMVDDKRYTWGKKVLDTCTGLFTQYNRVKSEEWIQSQEFFNLIKNVSVLTYILFCAFRNHCINRRNIFDLTKVEQELSDSRDIAEGVLQILENIILHSQNNEGYFSFRIHDNQNNMNNNYLLNTYREYLLNPIYNKCETFLEIFIADIFYSKNKPKNENILCVRFIDNLKERSIINKDIDPFIKKYKNLEVKDFFTNTIWKEYNKVSDNIIEHFGLQLFDKIVSSCNGCFEVISSDNYEYFKEQYYCSIPSEKHFPLNVIPGTQYKVLLPITERNFNQNYSGVDFYDYPKTEMLKPLVRNIETINIDMGEKIIEWNKSNKNKFKIVEEKYLKFKLINFLSEFIESVLIEGIQNNNIIHFVLNNIKGAGLIEIIFKSSLKAIIKIRNKIGNDDKIYIAFGYTTKEFITEFCYLMGIYYYKAEKSYIMKNTELYLWENSYSEDLLITGENLKIAHTAIFNRATFRGIFPRWINFINYIWKKYCNHAISNNNEIMTTLPYDVLIKYNDKTIFQNVVSKVLTTPMENKELGCLINNTHIQLEAKIHISEFYDGQILFLNNYFTNYFAYMIVDKIGTALNKKNYNSTKNIVLVGYEGYSEMLLFQTHALLISYLKKYIIKFNVLPYIISEIKDNKVVLRSAIGRLNKDKIEIKNYKDENNLFVFIVPINSTLSTFEKIQFEMEKLLNIKINEKNTLTNLALIISRDDYINKCVNYNTESLTEEEKEFWTIKSDNNITTKYKNIFVEYFVEVCGKWEKSVKCTQCFPINSVNEKPLIKTDALGLSPLTQIGQKKKWINDCNLSTENLNRVKKLAKVLFYNHIERGGNHYIYYFDTNAYFYQNKIEIDEWLYNIKTNIKSFDKQYSFIVSPLHSSNAGFTENVNSIIFNNTAHIIRLDFCKAYRSNFMMQFSYLRILYNNLLNAANIIGESSEINFYFVDDEIISGKTLLRAKSLLNGLFERKSTNDKIKINIFKKIFVLLERLSDTSKLNYINNIEDYISFVKFNISAIQNHDDFCFMCKLVSNARGYKYMSATNKMDESWKRIEKKFELKDYTWAEKNLLSGENCYSNRMLAAHYAEAEMYKLNENANVEDYFNIMLVKLFYTKLHKKLSLITMNSNNQEIFTSYLKILSRPFFIYRKNAKEAALKLIVIFMEFFLGKKFDLVWENIKIMEDNKNVILKNKLKILYNFIIQWRELNDESTYNLLIDLMEQLTDMESSYIIRKQNIINIFNIYDKIPEKARKSKNIVEKYREDFELQYSIFIKQITSDNADETKSLWIDKLFLYGNELFNDNDTKDNNFCNKYGFKVSFGQKVLIENTKIIYDGVKYLAEMVSIEIIDCYKNKILMNDNDKETYKYIKNIINQELIEIVAVRLKYFKKILNYNNYSEDKLIYSILLYILMFKLKTEEIPFDLFYYEFYQIIVGITESEVQILMIPNVNESIEDLVYSDTPCIIYDEIKVKNLKRIIKLEDKPLIESKELRQLKYEFDTYSIDDYRKQVVIKYSISSKHRDEKDYVYLILKYKDEQEIKKILFYIRLVLLCRSRTITRMKHDFNNNLFQSLWQSKKHNLLLEHFKNVSHNDPYKDDSYKSIKFMRKIDENWSILYQNTEKYIGLRIYKAMLLKLLADNNISSLYHEILSQRLMNEYVIPEKFSAGGVFTDICDIRFIFEDRNIDEMGLNQELNLPPIIIDKNVYNSYMYYIAPNVYRSQLIIISLIQNAYKHGNNQKKIHLYREKGIIINEYKIDYLCISNGISEDNIEMFRNRIEEHILKPINARGMKTNNQNNEGITLFSLSRYCNKILSSLGISKNSEIIKIEVNEEKIIFKIPILEGDRKECD